MKLLTFASELRKVGISNCSISHAMQMIPNAMQTITNSMQTIPQPSLWIINR